MDETQTTDVQSQVTASTDSNSANSAPASTETAPVAEKMVPQSTVDKVVGTRVKEAYERAKRDAMAEHQRSSAEVKQEVSQMGGMIQLTPEQLELKIQEVAHKMSNQALANQLAQEFESKIEAKKNSDPDFAKKYDALNIDQHPELILWTRGMDNVADVMGDIAEHPAKLANILMLSKSGFGNLAHSELTKLSSSIKANADAQKQPVAQEPLSNLKPSTQATDNGSMSVSDFMKIFRG